MASQQVAKRTQQSTPQTPHKRRRTDVDSSQRKITTYYSPSNSGHRTISLRAEAELRSPIYTSRVHIHDLPPKLLEAVLCYLPAEHLHHHVSHVCLRWRDSISDTQFLPWKMLYYHYQQRDPNTMKMMKNHLIENQITRENEQCVISMVRFLAMKFEVCTLAQSLQIMQCVSRHRLYTHAEDCIRTHTPELLNNIRDGGRWVVLVVVLLLLSVSVVDVMDLLQCLQHSSCPLSHRDLTELLWALTTLLYTMRDTGISITTRIHYNIFYVLYLMENTVPPVESNGTTEQQMQMTQEQQRVINHDLQPEHVVKVMAFAGTGKTTMLVRFAQMRPRQRLLYIAFNQPIATKAKQRFPKNVECRTVHSMAYEAVGKSYQPLKKITYHPKLFHLSAVLPEGKRGYVNAKVVSQTIESFCQSEDQEISTKHVPRQYKNTHGWIQTPTNYEKGEFVKIAKDVWEKMIELKGFENHAYCITPDVTARRGKYRDVRRKRRLAEICNVNKCYLKLWQLKKPVLSRYDVILIDEAQDCSPVIMDIVLSQSCGKILVGDPHQQIYSFRGAVNALYEVNHTHLYNLTQSFRFGSEIAYTGTVLLDVCKGEKRSLVGGRQDSSVCGDDSEVVSSVSAGTQSSNGRTAVLCRRNMTVFNEAARLVQTNPQCRIHFIGGVHKIGLRDIQDIWTLKEGEYNERQEIRHPLIQYFNRAGGYDALRHYITESEDKELVYKLSVVEKYDTAIPHLVQSIRNSSMRNPKKADFILGTVHKSKGLEFHTVILADDFIRVTSSTSPLQATISEEVLEDEWNLLYMAVTRGIRTVFLNRTLINILKMRGDCFLQAEMERGGVKCSTQECCHVISMTRGLVMRKLPITYVKSDVDGSAVCWECEQGGLVCAACVKKCLGVFAALLVSPKYTSQQ